MTVEFEEETCTMKMSDFYQFIDYGLDLYAPQSTVDRDGRCVVVAWARMPEAADRRTGEKWCGIFCLPRVVEVKKNHRKKEHIYFRVHPEIEKQYSRKIDSPAQAHEAGYRVSLDLQEGEAVDIGGFRIFRKSGRVCTDRSAVFCRTGSIWTQFSTPEVRDGFHLKFPNQISVHGATYILPVFP